MKRIYISAPISGCEDTAEERFTNAVRLAREHGFIAVNPWQENKSFCRWGEAVIAGLRLLNKCDAILLCDGWQHSRGCKIEQQFAQGAGIEVLFEESLKNGSPQPTKPAKFTEQSLAWNEEEEQGYEDVDWCINKALRACNNEDETGTCWFAQRWINSIKQRLGGGE